MKKPTTKQLSLLKRLIVEVQPDMVLPVNLDRNMASVRIAHLLKRRANPRIKPKYNN